jgi:hypothetical protein
MIETDILFAIFGAQNKKILNLQRNQRGKTLEGESPKQGLRPCQVGLGGPTPMPVGMWAQVVSPSFVGQFPTTS